MKYIIHKRYYGFELCNKFTFFNAVAQEKVWSLENENIALKLEISQMREKALYDVVQSKYISLLGQARF